MNSRRSFLLADSGKGLRGLTKWQVLVQACRQEIHINFATAEIVPGDATGPKSFLYLRIRTTRRRCAPQSGVLNSADSGHYKLRPLDSVSPGAGGTFVELEQMVV